MEPIKCDECKQSGQPLVFDEEFADTEGHGFFCKDYWWAVRILVDCDGCGSNNIPLYRYDRGDYGEIFCKECIEVSKATKEIS